MEVMDSQQLTVKLEQAALVVLSGRDHNLMTEASKFMNHAAKQLSSIMPLFTLLKNNNPGVNFFFPFFSFLLPRFTRGTSLLFKCSHFDFR